MDALHKKLKYQGEKVFLLFPPQEFSNYFKEYEELVSEHDLSKLAEGGLLLCFFRKETDLNTWAEKLSPYVNGLNAWFCYPKKGSGIASEITRDKGWDYVSKELHYHFKVLIAIDERWSGFRVSIGDGVQENMVKVRERSQQTKTHRNKERPLLVLAEDILAALQSASLAYDAFQKLAYSHQKEYLSWIDEAKKPETRQKRILKMIEQLQNGKK